VVPGFKEIQAQSAREKVLHSLGRAEKLPAMAEDSGLYIPSLGGFPGPITSFVQKKLSAKKLLRLLGERREASLVSVAGVRSLEGTRLFQGRVDGHIAPQPRGNSPHWIDRVFVPGGKRTIAEMGLEEFLPRSDWHQSFTQLAKYAKSL